MVRAIALAVLLAGCGKGGVEIVVEPAGDMTKVVLYVGVGDAITDPLLPPMHGMPFPSSSAWARDAYNELDVREVVAGEPAVFQFQGEGTLGVVLAVGYAGDTPVAAAVKHGIEVPADIVARYELALEPLFDGQNTSPLVFDEWQSQPGSPAAGKTCVALFDKRTSEADAVVTDGDPDCDGFPTDDPRECQPTFYMSFSRPGLEDAACLVTERVVTTDGTVSDGCVLGGPPCRDGVGKESACTAPTPYCMPKSVCNRCAGTASDIDCARDITHAGTLLPTHLQCKLYFDLDGKLCTSSLKAIGMPGDGIGGHACKTDGDHPVLLTTTGQPWTDKLQFSEGSAQLEVEVKNLESSCNFDIVVAGAAETRTLFGGIVAGMLDNGRGIAVPIVFELDPQLNVGCDNQVACQPSWSWDLTELVDQCVNTPVFPP